MGPNQILIIEDDPAVGCSLKDGLEKEGFDVHWETEGKTGIAHARKNNPHLIILDVRLPDGSGFDFCRQMRQLELRQPILILTARQDEMDVVLGLELGADDYMTKPFSLRELISRLRAMLRRAYGELSSPGVDLIYIADLTIDTNRGQVRRADNPVTLTPTEYRLFVYLARHPGQALTRPQIIEEVWGFDADVDSERTVNVHIRRLREKLELDPANPSLILTVPGIGYRLTEPGH